MSAPHPSPLVTVLMPVRDGAADVLDAVGGILGQTWRDLELIVVDDHSSDATAALLATVDDPRLLVSTPDEAGLVPALVHGTSLARGELIARADVDDRCHPDRIARQVAHLQAHPDVVVLGTSFEVVDAEDRVVRLEPSLCDDDDLRRDLYVRNPFGHGTTMIRSGALRRVGGYRDTHPYAEDYDLWCRLSRVGALAAIPEPLYRWRRHAGSASGRNSAAQHASVLAIRDELWTTPPEVLSAGELRRRRARYRSVTGPSDGLVDRFLQVQLAIVASAWARGERRLARLQLAQFLRHRMTSPVTLAWFVASGGRYVSAGAVRQRLGRTRRA